MTDVLYERVYTALNTLQLTTMATQLNDLTRQAATLNWSALDYLQRISSRLSQGEIAAIGEPTERVLPRNGGEGMGNRGDQGIQGACLGTA